MPTTRGRRALGALYRRNGLDAGAGAGRRRWRCSWCWRWRCKGSLWHAPLAGNFYAVFPHNLLVGAVRRRCSLFAVLALGDGRARASGATRRPAAGVSRRRGRRGDARRAAPEVPRRRPRRGLQRRGRRASRCARRRFHHFTFYGFMLCFAATCVATLYHYAARLARALSAAPACPAARASSAASACWSGPAGLLWLNLRRHPLHGDAAQRPMDRGFIALLFLTSATGLALAGLARQRAPWRCCWRCTWAR